MDGKYDPQTLTEIEKVKEWLNMDDPISIVTHQKVDADAAFSAALLKIRDRMRLAQSRCSN